MDPINPMPERSAAHGDLAERLRFETLLADLSAGFIHVPSDQLDAQIEDAQRRLCECLDLDRSSLWQLSPDDPSEWLLTHVHERDGLRMLLKPEGTKPVPAGTWLFQDAITSAVYQRIHSSKLFPWLLRELKRTRVVVVPRVEDLPEEAAVDRASFIRYGTRSNVIVALTLSGELLGCLSFATMRQHREWPDSLVRRFLVVADLFTNALARRQAEGALRESESRLIMATEAATTGLWSMESDTRRVWATSITRELFHFAPDQELTFDSFVDVIHPEDRQHLDREVCRAQDSGEPFCCEYRIVLPDGSSRWIVSRGRTHAGRDGRVDRLMGTSMDFTDRKQNEEALARSYAEIKSLQERLQAEAAYLREEVFELKENYEILGQSPAIREVLQKIEQVGPSGASVLILGETGTGKELIARAIHRCSPRHKHTMIAVNCGSLPEGLIESELFGREKGAYTDALTRQAGRFELAHNSTLFLDEIGDLPPGLQAKLLRVLQDGRFERLGSTQTITVDVRIIAATNRDMRAEVEAGKFRQDLYYRLNVFPIHVPPLRERREDIPLLVRAFTAEFGQKMKKEIEQIPKRSLDALMSYSWPGNLRELRNVIEHAVIVSRGRTLEVQNPSRQANVAPEAQKLDEAMAKHILTVLERTSWRVKGPNGAAELLGLKPTTLFSKMKKLGIPVRSKKYENHQ